MKPHIPNMPAMCVPAGYWQDAQGNLVPEANVRDIDKLRDQTVRLLFTRAEDEAA